MLFYNYSSQAFVMVTNAIKIVWQSCIVFIIIAVINVNLF